MKGFPVMLATLLVSGALAISQVCQPRNIQPSGTTTTSQVYVVPPVGAVPGTIYSPMVSSVPGTSCYPLTSTASGYYYYPMTGAIPGSAYYPMVSALPSTSSCMSSVSSLPMTSMSMASSVVSPICPSTSVSSDTACLLSQLAMLRGDIDAAMLVSQGQSLVSRMNQLMSQEQVFRQAIAINPNLPNAQMTALQLNADAQALNRDIASFNRQLALVPTSQRPFVAASLNSFDVAYWQPTVQSFATYQAQLPAAIAVYQPAFAQNPWLQTWFTNYQVSLAPISQSQQVFASASWWNQPMVLGSTEIYPSTSATTTVIPQSSCVIPTATTTVAPQTSCVIPTSTQPAGMVSMLPNGSVVYIPANVASIAGLMTVTPAVSMLPYPSMTTTSVASVPSTTTVVSPLPSTTTTTTTTTVAGTTETTTGTGTTAAATTTPPATTTTGENY